MKAALLRWWEGHSRQFPWRRTRNPFRLLVAEILLQQTPSWKVEPAYREIVRRWPDPAALARAPSGELEAVIRPLGLVSRAARLRSLGAAVEARGGVPSGLGALRELPGVGEYVARAVRGFAFGRTEALADNVSGRVLRRFFGLHDAGEPGQDPAVWELARAVAGRARSSDVNLALIDLGATVCKARRPLCPACPLETRCAWAMGQRSAPGGKAPGRFERARVTAGQSR